MRIALIDFDTVRNVVRWDGVTPWDPGQPTVELLADEPCGPGWRYHPGQSPRFTPGEE